MRRLAVLALLLSAPLAAWAKPQAQVLPSPMLALQTALSKAEAELAALHATIQTESKAHKAELKTYQRTLVTQLRLRQWPQGLMVAQATVGNQPNLPTLVAALQTQTHQRIASQQQKLTDLTDLYTQASSQMELLGSLQAQLANRRSKLTEQQRQALGAAAIQAESLTRQLKQAFNTHPQPNGKPKALSPRVTALAPVQGIIEHVFHDTAAPGATTEGLTYISKPGSTVQAVMEGTVLYSGPFRTFGGLVIVGSGGGLHTVYGGLATLAVEAGQTVTTGMQLGTTGSANPSRLYLEVRRRGRPIDPLPLLAGN